MSTFVAVKTKTGAYFYYKLVKGKKVRVPKSEVPEKDLKKMDEAKPKETKPKAAPAPKKVAKAKVVVKAVAKVVPKKEKVVAKKAKKVEGKTTTQCLKVANLRKDTGDKSVTLKKWMENPNNVYVGRFGRIFIGTGDEKKIFHYKGSEFANPYKVGTKKGEYTLEEAIDLYRAHLEDASLVEKAKKELKGKNLGCFCDQKGPCHAKVLAEIANGK